VSISTWTAAGLTILAGVAGFYAARRPRPGTPPVDRLRRDYLAGLNFLANEQPDRALEAFLRAAELDSETAETHLALGSLYRRRGEVDRAIRIHQNLVNRDSLEPELREQALYALAQDYLRSGLLDRAENILEGLAGAGAHRMAAMRHLIRIYELERDWNRAIATHEALARVGRPGQEVAIAHYRCELAEAARAAGRLDEAREHLKAAREGQRRFARAAIIRADIAVEQGDTALALQLMRGVIEQDAGLVPVILPRVLKLARGAGNGGDELVEELTRLRPDAWRELAHAAILAGGLDFPALERVFREMLRQDETLSGLIRALGRDVASLDTRAVQEIGALLKRLTEATPHYRCAECGFASTAHFWQCPGCKSWDSQRPVTRYDLTAGLDARDSSHT
jgi:lipopolysaccharide biosynthesis regulator YciM